MNEPNDFALVPRPPSEIEKAEPGAKRVLAGMVADALVLANRHRAERLTFTTLLPRDVFADMLQLFLEQKLGATHNLKFFYFERSSELLRLAAERSFDLVFMYIGNVIWDVSADDGSWQGAATVLGEMKTQYGKPIVTTQGLHLSDELEPKGVIFLNAPFTFEEFWARVAPYVPRFSVTREVEPLGYSRPLRIVLVNDETFVNEAVEMIIHCLFPNSVVSSFGDAASALKELFEREPDLLITDDVMPGMRGEELCERLLERRVRYPIIVDSPWEPTKRWVRRIADQGLNLVFLSCPFSIEELRNAIEATGLKDPQLDTREQAR